MNNYLQLMAKIVHGGELRENRTGTNSRALFGEQLKFNLQTGFPIVTTKRTWFRGIKEELAWMLRGETNVKPLQERGVNIWNEWADENGELGPVYGKQWVSWEAPSHIYREGEKSWIDQIGTLLNRLRSNPECRRHILSAWNVADIPRMALAPCHVLSQFYVSNDKRLSCHMYQRSCDFFLGSPFNIAQYALLTHAFADACGYDVGELIISYGDVHIYENHIEQCEEQMNRMTYSKPTLRHPDSAKATSIQTSEDLADHVVGYFLEGYQHHPALKGEIAV